MGDLMSNAEGLGRVRDDRVERGASAPVIPGGAGAGRNGRVLKVWRVA
jgi:hypothetical protein